MPWRTSRVPADPFSGIDDGTSERGETLGVFVPAIMGAGIIFSVVTLVRDAVRATGGRARRRRTAIEAATVVSELLGEDEPDPDDIGVLPRLSYVVSGGFFIAIAGYIVVAMLANFRNVGGSAYHMGWTLALAFAVAALLVFVSAVAFAVAHSWPHPPAWTYGTLRLAPLTHPRRLGLGPTWTLTAGVLVAATASALLSVVVGANASLALRVDEPILEWIGRWSWLDQPGAVDPLGSTVISIGFVVLIGLSAFRCRVMAVVYPAAFVASWTIGEVLRQSVHRQRPMLFSDFKAFPSGHMVQAVFIAGLLPLALAVLLSDQRVARIARVVLWTAVVVTGLHRIHQLDHWPLDVIGGVLFGLTVVLATHWVLDHRVWHQRCVDCPWSAHPHPTPWAQGVFDLRPAAVRRLRRAAPVLAIGAAGALLVAAVLIGLPRDPEGVGLASAISAPIQITMTALMAVAGLLALRWRGLAAFLMALASMGVGLFAAVQYRPWLAITLTVVLLVPAVVTWLAWQPHETIGSIAALAVLTAAVLTTTAFGSREIYAHYFGPTHPPSTASELASDEADWLFVGATTSHSSVVVAGGLDPGGDFELIYWPTDTAGIGTGSGDRVVSRTADGDGIARFTIESLEPSTRYDYALRDAGSDIGSAAAHFTTHAMGPQNLTVVAGACARTGSNGAVFDAMVAEGADLYLALGDLHYSNLESTDPSDHIDALGDALSQPGQAALFSTIPTAYVWDDHDFGPNDADGSSPSRLAVSTAYRQAVPHFGVDPDPNASIAQAFTVGRVRFVMSDTRSQRDATTMLGTEQLEWLLDELVTSAETHAVVIWANPTPWIGTGGEDDWSLYPDERGRIGDAIAAAGIDNLIMVSGDAHMVAIDDGTNSDYATDGGGGFPVLHAAALDRPGSAKGGPYSHGAFPGGGQYGVLEITDDGGPVVSVSLSGHTWDDQELVRLDLEFAAEPTIEG